MEILTIVIIIFIILESANVFILYFKPDSKLGNGVAVFDAWEESKKYPEIHEFIKYLVYWVAGTKLIFIGLLFVIIVIGNSTAQLYSVAVLIISIITFFWRLYPMIRHMDKDNQISPKGYSKTLGIMIAIFIAVFVISFVIGLLF